jgi:SAM-dependent methyltransferase
MATTSEKKTQYDDVATEYKSYDDLPMARLEAELIRTALGDCTGLAILDLGGGSGTHARQAVRAGARLVDVADISEGMMQIGKEIEAQAGGVSRIRWHVADAARPLTDQGVEVLPPGRYDVVMANWVFDHAHTVDDLEGMWANIGACLKRGGRFVGIRVIAPGIWAEHTQTGKYGCIYEDIDTIPGGVRCKVILATRPPFSFGGTMMEDSYGMVNDIPRRFGVVDFETVPAEDTRVIREDLEFWKEHLERPLFAVVTARKD